MKNPIITLLLVILIALLAACESYLQIEPPNNKLDSHSVFADSVSASSAITGIYAEMTAYNLGFLASQGRWAALYSGELEYTGTSDPIIQFTNQRLNIDNSNINTLWSNIYKHIYQANSIIERTQLAEHINERAKQKLVGEARFVRAFLFFYAVNNWGGVPLTITTDYRENESLPRATVDEVYMQIIADLEFASDVLSTEYINAERTRPNRLAAMSLLARVYLYKRNWTEANYYANQVIDSEIYAELPAPPMTYLKESTETIWQLFPATYPAIFNSYDGYYFVPSSMSNSTIPAYLIPDELYNSFEAGDLRKENWIGIKPNGQYLFPYKYKVRQSAQKSEYTVVFRMSELCLIRAEASAHLGNLRSAIHDINLVRERAGLRGLPEDLSSEETIRSIKQEKYHEFFCEWGHRWYDLKRYGSSAFGLWPIPVQQIITNPKLVQNENY
ncbi:RagB/SusD family nutrient uptake outer membrane protein [Sphingobacterium spiritivorum]|uniref:RagB/SusD family nutrient uptake outer membrane protein n=1 Tax=Sphingobacterium spiritivorum TaxID=258 RepID=UPI003DA3DFEA